jgi:hypothetical protein
MGENFELIEDTLKKNFRAYQSLQTLIDLRVYVLKEEVQKYTSFAKLEYKRSLTKKKRKRRTKIKPFLKIVKAV